MADKLGIFVSSDQHLTHFTGIARAASQTGKEVTVFLTNRGVLLTQDPRFPKMEGLAKINLCNVNFAAFKLGKPLPLVVDFCFVLIGE
ncbi:hypothetical protein DFAR_1430019 [Desulfarculales bacterium]